MKRLLTTLTAASLLLSTISTATAEQPLVSQLEDGRLDYRELSNGDRIPDFSYCGYEGGGVMIPMAPVKTALTPGNGGDDTERIQAAIDKLGKSSTSKPQAILLKAGTYRVSGTLKIKDSNIVLRGEGQLEGGTVIIATGKEKRTLIHISGGKPGNEIKGTRQEITDDRIPVGSRTVHVSDSSKFRRGDPVIVLRKANDKWISVLGTDKLNRGPKDKVKNWTPESYHLRFERTVTAVDGNAITVDAPITCAIEKKYGGGSVYKTEPDGRIHHVGIENMRLVSEYEKGKEKSDEDHAWDAIKIVYARDSWVRNVTAQYFGYSCVHLTSRCKNITVQDSACLDPVSKISGGRRYSFAVAGQLCLVQRCYTRGGRHDYVMHARVPGPNAFLDCVADKTHSDSGPHHRWSTGTLYDNIKCGALNVQWRGRSGTGHGWAGANMVFWNCRTRSIDCQKPPTANNYCIGCTGKIKGSGYMESKGEHVEPRSLYLTQLNNRLGDRAVRNIVIREQYTGIIDDLIRKKLSEL